MTLGYKAMVRAIAHVYRVNESDMGRFDARIRQLLDAGLAPERPGTGAAIAYTERHILSIVVGLALGDLGQPPKTAAHIAEVITRFYDESQKLNHYIVFSQKAGDLDSFWHFVGEERLAEAIRQLSPDYDKWGTLDYTPQPLPPAFTTLNLSFYAGVAKDVLGHAENTR